MTNSVKLHVPFKWKSSHSVRYDKLGQKFRCEKRTEHRSVEQRKKSESPTGFFLCPTLMLTDQFTFHLSLPSLKFTIFIHLPQKFRMFRKTRDTFAEFPEYYVIFASSLIAKRDKQVKVIAATLRGRPWEPYASTRTVA